MSKTSMGRRLDKCEGCGRETLPDQLREIDTALTEVHPYPETLLLCPVCYGEQAAELDEQAEEVRWRREERGECPVHGPYCGPHCYDRA